MTKADYSTLARRAALLGGWSYLIVVWSQWSGSEFIAWKGLGVGFLAVFAALAAHNRAGWMIAAVLAFGAAGDVVLDINFMMGAVLFALGHVVAIMLYWQERRPELSQSQRGLSRVVAVVPPLIAWLLTHRTDVVFYTILLSIMACLAWRSRFSRYSVGLGAMAFVASDLLIFARMGPLADQHWASLAIWTLYFGGQYLIAIGVVSGLGKGSLNQPR